ncbi:MAG: HAD-IA family hydrolase [Acutalibacteraceae bacterium]|nr:HAD-IA family hydrolase [Acutalibacteraceae bacterium]
MNTILFDLDGTLVPITQEDFSRVYFGLLIQKAKDMNIDTESMKKGLFGGVNAMVNNDGSALNENAFWQVFLSVTKADREATEPIFRDFYANEFKKVKSVMQPTEISKMLIKTLKDKGYRLILATNPLFPIEAVVERMSWVGLTADDFEYITTYENSSYCKPNPKYFADILEKLNLKAEDCLMVGNNTVEDMAAQKAGIKTFLVTDVLENEKNIDISTFENGSLEEFYKKAQDF